MTLITPSHVDIFSPLDAPPLRRKLQILPHILSSTYQPSPERKHWVMSSLENMTFQDSYHPLSQIELFMRELVDAHPETACLINLGRRAEGRDILGLIILRGVDDDSEEDIGGKKRRAEDAKEFGRHSLTHTDLLAYFVHMYFSFLRDLIIYLRQGLPYHTCTSTMWL